MFFTFVFIKFRMERFVLFNETSSETSYSHFFIFFINVLRRNFDLFVIFKAPWRLHLLLLIDYYFWFSFFALADALKANTANTLFPCPNDKTGQFSDPIQCDKYYTCDDGIATELLCPDGLVFDETNKLINKCDQPFNVDCGNRTELQEPKSLNEKCPRKNGFFAHPVQSVCNIFYNCIDGDAIEMACTTGLHFDEYSGTCVWPDTANREGCKSAEGELHSFF